MMAVKLLTVKSWWLIQSPWRGWLTWRQPGKVMKLDILHSCCLSNEMSFSHSRHFRIRIAMTTRSAWCFYRCCAALFWTLKKQQCLFTASFFPPLYLRSPNVEVCWLYSVSYFIFYLWSAKMLAQEKEETLSNPIKGSFPWGWLLMSGLPDICCLLNHLKIKSSRDFFFTYVTHSGIFQLADLVQAVWWNTAVFIFRKWLSVVWETRRRRVRSVRVDPFALLFVSRSHDALKNPIVSSQTTTYCFVFSPCLYLSLSLPWSLPPPPPSPPH